MERPRYRKVARAFVDDYLSRKGMAPCTWPEDESGGPVEAAEEEPAFPAPYARVG